MHVNFWYVVPGQVPIVPEPNRKVLQAFAPSLAVVTVDRYPTGREITTIALTAKSVAVVNPKVRVPVEVVPGTMSAGTEKAAVETADTAPAANAGRVPMDVLVVSIVPALFDVLTVYDAAGWELPTV